MKSVPTLDYLIFSAVDLETAYAAIWYILTLQAIASILCTHPLLHDRVAHIEQLNPALVAKAGTQILME